MAKITPAPYTYPKHRRKVTRPSTHRVKPYEEKEVLTGQVNGQDASDIEERFARALNKQQISFEFRVFNFAPVRNVPGADETDFMVYSYGAIQPVEIDGEFAHKTQAQRAGDLAKDAVLNDYLSGQGYNPVMRIPDGTVTMAGILDEQGSADALVEELFL